MNCKYDSGAAELVWQTQRPPDLMFGVLCLNLKSANADSEVLNFHDLSSADNQLLGSLCIDIAIMPPLYYFASLKAEVLPPPLDYRRYKNQIEAYTLCISFNH